MFTCMICNKQFSQITGKHLKLHGLNTVSEYKAMFPNVQTVRERKDSAETLEKKRIARTGKKHTQEAKDKIGAKHKGKKRSAEEIDKWRVSYAQYLEEHGSPMLGKDRGEAFKLRMSEIAKARPPEIVREKVRLMNEARRGSKATSDQQINYINARLKYIEENPDKLPKKMFNTKPEREFSTILDSIHIPYKRNVNIGGRLYDFKIRDNILIEIDGPYHWNFKMYGNRNMLDEERMALFLQAQEIDKLKTKIAQDNGYRLYRIIVEGNLPDDWEQQLINQGYKLL